MLIAFVHNQQSFLPEVRAYEDYFSKRGVQCEIVKEQSLPLLRPDVAWYFMGSNTGRLANAIIIHEYTSASVAPFAGMKNVVKKWLNVKPDYRLFLNDFVRESFDFKDGVPHGLRDMGIPADWLQQTTAARKADSFIYTGEWKGRNIEQLLQVFSRGALQGQPLVILSKEYELLQEKYREHSNIRFKGPASAEEVRRHVSEAAFAINFIPDKVPFNRQTSTKLLEYAACKTPIITTDYAWVRQFQQKHGGDFFYLQPDLSNFTLAAVKEQVYSFPDLSDWTWEWQIKKSGVTGFLAGRFPDINW